MTYVPPFVSSPFQPTYQTVTEAPDYTKVLERIAVALEQLVERASGR